MIVLPATELVIVVVGFLIAFVLAFGVGANDVANSFGTSVGSKALSLRTACILATICELAGSILLGGRVSSTIRKNIIDLGQFNASANGTDLMLYGHLSALGGSCIWLLLATLFKLPVSGSHSIVGAVIGFSLVRFGKDGVNWSKVGEIVGSWFLSPIASGVVSTIIFFCIKKTVLEKDKPLTPALMTLPFLYGIIIAINTFAVVIEGLKSFGVHLPLWAIIVTPVASGLATVVIVLVLVIPLQRRRVQVHMYNIHNPKPPTCTEDNQNPWKRFRGTITRFISQYRSPPTTHNCVTNPDLENKLAKSTIGGNDSEADLLKTLDSTESSVRVSSPKKQTKGKNETGEISIPTEIEMKIETQTQAGLLKDRPEEAMVFSSAQVLTAMFGSFAHGGNDVSNAIGPLIGLWILITTGEIDSNVNTPIWILVYGGVGISVGLWIWGRRVIETIGEDLTTITPSSGVAIEIGSALTVLIASNLGLPISTTHCKVGSVVCVGRFRSKENVNWRLFLNIFMAWVVTLPVSGGTSALLMWILTRHIS
uniref:Phosphate transporter n=2 Tax=Mesocestoides corti TaxID=53468 RepID=A0A5K3FBV5_MESCO